MVVVVVMVSMSSTGTLAVTLAASATAGGLPSSDDALESRLSSSVLEQQGSSALLFGFLGATRDSPADAKRRNC